MCCNSVARFILISFNILFLLFGGLCMGIGIWVKVDQGSLLFLTRVSSNSINLDVPSLIESASYMLIGGGAMVFIVAFLGFCGAIKQMKVCLYTYATFVLLILLTEIAAAVMAIVFKSSFDIYAKTYLNKALTQQYVGPYSTSDPISLAFDFAQVKLQCCGINNGTDYAAFNTWNTTWTRPSTNTVGTAQIPFTCCMSNSTTSYPTDMSVFITGMVDDNCPVSEASSYTTGCYGALVNLFQTYLYVTLGVGIGVGIIELLGVISACYLGCSVETNKVQSL